MNKGKHAKGKRVKKLKRKKHVQIFKSMALPGFKLAPPEFAISENEPLTTAPRTRRQNGMASTADNQEIYRNRCNSSFCLAVRSTHDKFMNLASLGIRLIRVRYLVYLCSSSKSQLKGHAHKSPSCLSIRLEKIPG